MYKLARGAFAACVGVSLLAAVTRLSAHPMPHTVIAVSLRDDGATFDIAVPLPELVLALPSSFRRDADPLAEPQRSIVEDYFDRHVSVRSRTGAPQPHTLESLTLWHASADDVGGYRELRVRLFAPLTDTFNPRDFTLAYDAVIHQVPNHVALVEIAQDFRAGRLAGDRAEQIGVIRFDFALNATPPLAIATTAGTVWRGLRSVIALGFRHVATGFDHVLFLLTLLIVAPLQASNGRWSLFQGWRYTARRFLAISLAFTIGHSLALFIGTYDVVPVPRAAIEILIAASTLVAALHAIRPLFANREWLVAATFGTVHGLAFSEALVDLHLSPWLRGLTVLGFNVGVEGAQLVVMAMAMPLLVASRWPQFHLVRVWTMVGATLLAVFWIVGLTVS